ncbi:hypothetical protein SAMN05444285_12076 [Draconibacterium orientale]|uniref:Probable membrane transporter protein n=1 Tax=Draconibacterium orientale TaxID=1168034 RepID=X5DM45_9BACT|nr:sulfite exporter TauE/SafE family protein [Draconibacterium orientale]AHW62309.1 hypothetical protein FH5T_19370 [Draconibacterium orientale]SET70584.1 hypothetical protein SAMN05444285_12076 [Draconibacterium orientale]
MLNIWVVVTVVISSFVKGLTGFGFALLSLPVLLTWYTPKEIIPVLMICNFIASVLIVLQNKTEKLIDKQAGALIATGGIFTLVGVSVLNWVNNNMLVNISGAFFIVLTLVSMVKKESSVASIPGVFYPLAGAFIGFISRLISISGPPLALFLNKAKVSNQQFREIFAWFSVITAAIAIVGYKYAGLLTVHTIKTALLFTPILLSGTILGKQLNASLSVSSFKIINTILTLIASVLLILNR